MGCKANAIPCRHLFTAKTLIPKMQPVRVWRERNERNLWKGRKYPSSFYPNRRTNMGHETMENWVECECAKDDKQKNLLSKSISISFLFALTIPLTQTRNWTSCLHLSASRLFPQEDTWCRSWVHLHAAQVIQCIMTDVSGNGCLEDGITPLFLRRHISGRFRTRNMEN